MQVARVFQWVLLGFLSLGFLAMVAGSGSMAFSSSPTEGSVGEVWSDALDEMPDATEPQEYSDFDYSHFVDDPSPEILDQFSDSNAFLASSGLLMVIGIFGFVLMTAAVAERPSGRFAGLTVGGTLAMVGVAFWLFGFNTAYPGDFALGGLLPAGVGGPVLIETNSPGLDYGMGMTMVTDFFYQMLFAMTAALMVLGLAAGRYRTPTVVLTATAVGMFGFPLAACWLWGAGWLSSMNALDFAGSAMIHTLAGGAALALVVLARLCPAHGPGARLDRPPALRPDRRRKLKVWEVAIYVIGLLVFLMLVGGANAGSVLSDDIPVVAAVLNNTLAAVGGGLAVAAIVSIFLARRSRWVIAGIGTLAGWAAICAPADCATVQQAAGIGAVAGGLAALVAWAMDLGRFDDPMGVIPISLVGGAVGVLSVGLFYEDGGFLPQVMLLLATSVLGFTLAASIGLLTWLCGILWDGNEPVAKTEVATPSAG
ncbi:ammonium transporter channel protein [Haloferula helveola]|uniref:Ammonium transporter channel protein n=1 Tax=Haloferula helveola TaxID=490095 RepID=A0ABM7RCG3_9BACT|nr:ammonium transporter channel protein [Haloferula helveola]